MERFLAKFIPAASVAAMATFKTSDNLRESAAPPDLKHSRAADDRKRVPSITVKLGNDVAQFLFFNQFFRKHRFRDSDHRQNADFFPRAFLVFRVHNVESEALQPRPGKHGKEFRADISIAAAAPHNFPVKTDVAIVRGVRQMRNVPFEIDVLYCQSAAGTQRAQQFRDHALAFWKVGQQKPYVEQIVDGILIPFEDIGLPEFNVPDSFFCDALAGEFELYRIHVQAVTRPFGPARRAISNVTSPAPQPRSRQFMPSRIPAR